MPPPVLNARTCRRERVHPHHDGWEIDNSLLMRPLLSSALGIERPGRDGISDPGDLRITVHQVSEECALQIALVATEQDNSDREGLHILRGLHD